MRALNCHITINNLQFDFVNKVEVNSTWRELIDTATITLPLNYKIDNQKISESFKVGHPVKIKLGYDDDLTEVFSGFVTSVSANFPIQINCEDNLYLLKKQTISLSGKQTVKQLLNAFSSPFKIADIGLDLNFLSFDLGNIEFDNITKAKALQEIKNNFNIYSFFRNGTLVIGKQYNPFTATTHKVEVSNFINNNLEFRLADNYKIKVTAISNLDDGKKIEQSVGDSEGEEKTLKFYNIDKKTLKLLALTELRKLKFDGYRGDFTMFGSPTVKHGDIIQLIDKNRIDLEGAYFVDEVNYSFGMSGYRQKIKLGVKA